MTRKRPKGASSYRDRHGKLWWKFRAKGLKTIQTRELFDSVAWWAVYNAFLEGERAPQGAGAERTRPGSFNALVVAYYTSADFQLLSKNTQGAHRRTLDRLREKHGDKPAVQLRPEHLRRMLDARAATPAAANNFLKVMRALMRFGVERGTIKDNPTLGVKRLADRTDGFHAWSDDEIAAFDAHWPLGTQERLAKDLLLYTAQRSADVRVMGLQHLRDGFVRVRQQKTGVELEIPLHQALKASIAARPSNNLTFLVTQHGQPYTGAGFGNWFREAARKAGLPVGLSAHGLRKAAARRLAEAGCTAHQIQAVTGHKTLKEVERYTRTAAQKGLAEAAMAMMGRTEPEQDLSNQAGRLDNSGAK